ncbi:unnamed protein product [Ectocarpus sp. CCAP 1310/34]|nr:unnamed protein product [Ectocarpus sp. CCAP 1310/34]
MIFFWTFMCLSLASAVDGPHGSTDMRISTPRPLDPCVTDDDCTVPDEICCPSLKLCDVPLISGACRDPIPAPTPGTPAPTTPGPITPESSGEPDCLGVER